MCGDFNCSVGKYANAFDIVHGNQGFGTRSTEGFRFVDLCTAVNLVTTNTSFKKLDIQLITYKSGSSTTQLILTKRSNLISVKMSK